MSKRRAKGDGSVYTRKDGRIVAEWTDAHGCARYMTSTKMSKAVRKKLQERDESITHDSKNLTVDEYVDRWLESTQDTVSLRTYQCSESSAKLHLVPTFSPLGRHHEHDATRRALAHRLEPYSPKLVDEGPRGSILLIPSTPSTPH